MMRGVARWSVVTRVGSGVVAGVCALLLSPTVFVSGCAADQAATANQDDGGAGGTAGSTCSDPQHALRSALSGASTPLLQQAEANLRTSLSAAELDYLAKLDWSTLSEAQAFADPTVTKGVAAVRPLVQAACPGGLARVAPSPTLLKQAFAADTRCLVSKGNANAIAGGITVVGSLVACAATVVGAPICVAGTLIALAIVLDSPSACGAERPATDGGGPSGPTLCNGESCGAGSTCLACTSMYDGTPYERCAVRDSICCGNWVGPPGSLCCPDHAARTYYGCDPGKACFVDENGAGCR